MFSDYFCLSHYSLFPFFDAFSALDLNLNKLLAKRLRLFLVDRRWHFFLKIGHFRTGELAQNKKRKIVFLIGLQDMSSR